MHAWILTLQSNTLDKIEHFIKANADKSAEAQPSPTIVDGLRLDKSITATELFNKPITPAQLLEQLHSLVSSARNAGSTVNEETRKQLSRFEVPYNEGVDRLRSLLQPCS